MKIVTSWDDGSQLDIKLSELLLRYELPGIFYISTVCELLPIDIKKLQTNGFKIGGHTNSHPQDMKLLDHDEQFEEIKTNKEWLEEIIGDRIKSFCYPRGRYNDVTIEILKELGFEEARTTTIFNTEEPEDIFRIQTSIHTFPNRPEYRGQHWLDLAKATFDLAKSKNGYFHVWGHSWEIDLYDEWDNVEKLFKYIKQNGT